MASKLFLGLAALAVSLPLATSALAAQSAAESLKVDTRLGYKLLRAGAKQRVYLRIGLTGIHDPDESETVRAPVNIALVIDRSGSMRGAKMAKAREAAIMAVDRLTRRDIASVISFSKKCGNGPRSMSRVVMAASVSSSGCTGSSVPSYAKRRIPSIVPARAASSTMIWPRLPWGLSGLPGVSPSMRR